MKPLIKIIIILSIISSSLLAGGSKIISDEHPKKYCIKMQGGELQVMHKGKEIKSDVSLSDGSKIKINGTLIKKDGTIISLKEGDCVDADGKISEENPAKKQKNKS